MTISLEQLQRCTVAVDMGASRTRVYLRDIGLVVDEATAAAVNTRTGAIVAVGNQVEQMAGRTPDHIRVVRPVGAGGITDIEMAQRLLRQLVDHRVRRAWRFHPNLRAAACVPHESEPLVQRAVIDTLASLGARKVLLVDTLIAAGVGCGLPVEEAEGMMIVVCGAAMTQIAVLSMGSVVAAEKVMAGGAAVHRALAAHLRNRHELVVPAQHVRQVHRELSLALADEGAHQASVRGWDAVTGEVREVRVDAADAQAAADMPMLAVLDGIRAVLRRCPPDLVADVGVRGIVLAGGNATMPGFQTMLQRSVQLPVTVGERPDIASILGLGSLMDNRPVTACAAGLPEDERASRKAKRLSRRARRELAREEPESANREDASPVG
ncbi:rod shape-determining protein [Streptomyces polyrhachis]|uniref:Rod shape-determining protein n=1 Tax=Streptomyces polyrhachis TaxID=1282885 RepID=A0ABW2GGW1_9ACTN